MRIIFNSPLGFRQQMANASAGCMWQKSPLSHGPSARPQYPLGDPLGHCPGRLLVSLAVGVNRVIDEN